MNYYYNNDNDTNNNDNEQLVIIIIMIIKILNINSCYKLFQIEFEMLLVDDIFISFYILRFYDKSSKVWNFFIIS